MAKSAQKRKERAESKGARAELSLVPNLLPESSHERVASLDLARGLTVIAMVLFHFTFDLAHFAGVRAESLQDTLPNWYWRAVPMAIGTSFLFILGISAWLRYQQDQERAPIRFVRRGVQLFLIALGITLVTRYGMGTPIYFGILHCMAAAFLLLPLFLDFRRLALRVGLSTLAIGAVLMQFRFDFSGLLWLGFTPKLDGGWDYYPLLPWFGFVLVGFWCGKPFEAYSAKLNSLLPKGPWVNKITFLGQHSLAIYLVHQPVLIGLIWTIHKIL